MTREMKDSGIEWIGQIPKEWNVFKVKDGFYQKKKKANIVNPTVLSLARDGVKVRDISNNEGQLAADYSQYNPVEPGDMLLNPMDLYSGANCSLSKVSGVISPAYVNLKAKKDFSAEFYDYYFKYQYWSMAFFSYGKGVSFDNRWTLNNESLMKFPLVTPNYKEQVKIALYLDSKCSQIDSILTNLQDQIDTLEQYKKSVITEAVTKGLNPDVEMKDSGVEFVENIPVHWLSNKMNRVCLLITDYVANGSFADLAKNVTYLDYPDYAMLIRTADISGKAHITQPVYIDEASYNFLKNSNLFGGEIILPNIGASVGDVYIAPKLYSKMSLAPNSIMIKTNQVDKYFYYFFSSIPGRKNLIDISGASAQAKFNKTDLRQMKVPQPPIEEQQEIVKYLDNQCNKIDAVITAKKSQLETLVDCKKSLIYEYVTGKKEVPNEHNIK